MTLDLANPVFTVSFVKLLGLIDHPESSPAIFSQQASMTKWTKSD